MAVQHARMALGSIASLEAGGATAAVADPHDARTLQQQQQQPEAGVETGGSAQDARQAEAAAEALSSDASTALAHLASAQAKAAGLTEALGRSHGFAAVLTEAAAAASSVQLPEMRVGRGHAFCAFTKHEGL